MDGQVIEAKNRLRETRGFATLYHSYDFLVENTLSKNLFPLSGIKECILKPGMGFLPHEHKDIFSIIMPLEGGMIQKTKIGKTYHLKTGTVTFCNAGLGIEHFEYNESEESNFRCFVIELKPKKQKTVPFTVQKEVHVGLNEIVPLTEPNDAFSDIADFRLFLGTFDQDTTYEHSRHTKYENLLVYILSGNKVKVDQYCISTGDTQFLWDITNTTLPIKCNEKSSFLLMEF